MSDLIVYCVPWIIGLLAAGFMHMRPYLAAYITLVAGLFALNQYVIGIKNILIISSVIVGLVVHFVLMGCVGSRIGTQTYQALLSGIGLFPWFAGFLPGVLYVLFFLLFSAIASQIRHHIATKKYHVNVRKTTAAQRYLDTQQYELFRHTSQVRYQYPFIASGILTLALTLA